MNNRFMKDFNGEKIFSLEYDKETLKDMVLEKQEEIERLNKEINKAIEYLENIPRVLTRTDVIYLLMILKENDIELGVLKALNEDLEDDVPMG